MLHSICIHHRILYIRLESTYSDFITKLIVNNYFSLTFLAPIQCPALGLANVWLPGDSKSAGKYPAGSATAHNFRIGGKCAQVRQRPKWQPCRPKVYRDCRP